MTTEADILAIDPDLLALLRDTGIDPRVYLKRRAELKAWRQDPAEAEKLAREQDALRPALESCNAWFDEHGLWCDGLTAW